jgi:murein DD-endopeptidase MepM/ murein hydrolase activator NlpD
MQIIFVHPRLSRAHTFTFKPAHFVLAALGGIIAIFVCSSALYYLTFKHAAHIQLPLIRDLFLTATKQEQSKKDQYLRENLNSMAMRVGEMQAQLLRLNALGERVSGMAGLKPGEIDFKNLPGRGGALTSLEASREISLEELNATITGLSRTVEGRSDVLNLIESELMHQRVKSRLIPTFQPVQGYNGSGFGSRIDPFSGRSAHHQGIDFQAPPGTPILAAAGGVIIAAEMHPGFGNMLEIDHGNELMTRYAHNSKLLVKPGDIVKPGQKIAELGSTGRSTGPHLHFEVHVRGVAQDPMKFLESGGAPSRAILPATTPSLMTVTLPEATVRLR